MSQKIKTAIIGIGGYTGFELIKILLNHSNFELAYAGATNESQIKDIFPCLNNVVDLKVEIADVNEINKRCELVFLALPHKEAMKFAKELNGKKIVDLSADYRVSLQNYEKNYCKHLDEIGLKNAVYGLVEINRNKIKNASLVANPGCYPTCSLLALIPFAKFFEAKFGVMIDAKSGLSGAGKGLKQSSHFVSVNENITPYNPLTHRHSDEIKEHLNIYSGENLEISFIPHLIPITRGMMVSAFGMLKNEFLNIKPLEILREFYKNDPFVRILDEPVNIKNVIGTHFCDIFAINKNGRIWINSSIDNLLRGASSQAVANANLIFNLDENLGLPRLASLV